MSGKRPLGAGIVLFAVLVFALGLWGYHRDGDPDPPNDIAPASAPGSDDYGLDERPDTGREGLPAPRMQAPPAPLPDLETPLRLVVDELRRRADAGDAPAACRLAAELERCNHMRSLLYRQRTSLERAERHMDQTSGEAIEEAARALAGMGRAHAGTMQAVEHCAGVEEPSAGDRFRYWRRAALAGHVPAMRHYAIGNAFRFRDLMGALPELEVYRREAEVVAQRAAAAGDPAMIHALAMAYLPRDGREDVDPSEFRPFLAQVISPDPRQALAWLYTLQRHPGLGGLPHAHPSRALQEREIGRLESQLSTGDVAAARSAAADNASGWLPGVADAIRLPVHANGGIGDVGREECDPDWTGGESSGQ